MPEKCFNEQSVCEIKNNSLWVRGLLALEKNMCDEWMLCVHFEREGEGDGNTGAKGHQEEKSPQEGQTEQLQTSNYKQRRSWTFRKVQKITDTQLETKQVLSLPRPNVHPHTTPPKSILANEMMRGLRRLGHRST